MSEVKTHKHEHSHFQLDRIGIGVSMLCLVHCLSLPILLVFAPFVHFLGDWHQPFHAAVFILAAPVAYVSLRQGYRHHKKLLVLALGGAGCALIFINVIVDIFSHTDIHYHTAEFTPTLLLGILGGILLATAHVLNIRGCRH